MTRVTWTSVRRALAARRRLVAAALAGLAVLCALSAVRPPAPPTVLVLAASRDLAPGAALALDDLRSVALPAALVPSGALRPGAAVLGRLVSGPVRRGEPLTDVRLVGPGLLTSLAPGDVAVPVRFADAGALALLRPGDRIDVLAAPSTPPAATDSADTAATVVAANVTVLAIPRSPGSSLGGAGDGVAPLTDGALVVVACPPAVARALATAAARARLSPALRAPPEAPP